MRVPSKEPDKTLVPFNTGLLVNEIPIVRHYEHCIKYTQHGKILKIFLLE